MFFVAYGDCTNDLGRGEAMLMCRHPVAGERSLVTGVSFLVLLCADLRSRRGCAIVLVIDPIPGLSSIASYGVWVEA